MTETSNTALKSSVGPRPIPLLRTREKENEEKGIGKVLGLTKITNLFICKSRRVRLNLVLPAESGIKNIPSQKPSLETFTVSSSE